MAYALFAFMYCATVLFIAALSGKNTSGGMSDYYLANRSARRWMGAFSASASSESAWVMMGLVGAAYSNGFSVFWLIPGCAMGYAVNWFLIAPPLHNLATESKAVTLAGALSYRLKSPCVGVLITIIGLIFMTAYLSSQFLAIGRLFHTTTQISVTTGTIIGSLFVLAYVGYGGMRASLVTDLIQALLVVAVLIILPLYGLYLAVVGGYNLNGLPAGYASFTAGKNGLRMIALILGWAGIGLAYPGQPHVLQRHMVMRDSREVSCAGLIAITWSILVFGGAILSGIIGRILIPHPADKEQILLYLGQIPHSAPIAGLVIAAIFAASAGTADSQLLAVSASLKNDIPHVRALDWIGPRFLTVAVALIGAVIAGTQSTTIFALVLFAWEFLGATIGIAVIGTFLIPRSPTAIVGSMAIGAATLMTWRNVEVLNSALYALVPAIGLALSALYLSRYMGASR